jgi:hypothetical protein
MPFIRGRYYINPIAGAAIEKAREADDSDSGSGDEDESNGDAVSAGAPVRRIEIDATEIVPPATGRAQRGFVARVHRGDAGAGMPSAKDAETRVFTDHRDLLGYLGGALEKG